MNLQTSFLTPPFGFSLFYLRGVAPPSLRPGRFMRGVLPFIVIQVVALALICVFPSLVTGWDGLTEGRLSVGKLRFAKPIEVSVR